MANAVFGVKINIRSATAASLWLFLRVGQTRHRTGAHALKGLFLTKWDIKNSPMRVLWFLVGAVALLLGAAGVILPLLPTTPFVILAAFAFGKSSPVLQTRLEQSRLFGPAIRDWRVSGAISARYKVLAVTMMAAALAFGLFSAMPFAAKLVQVAAIAAAATFVLSRPGSAK
ncbi:YbaN family protein [Pseudorhodobacter ferrugineus]|uniref:YbaN family protein n=1 Tax=Pseudorhodobacter ferrugineus TaxID=77008 RepID=UPI0012DBDB9B|nr:YbaN family protein [Pseudorhodobacter ferrugineus]